MIDLGRRKFFKVAGASVAAGASLRAMATTPWPGSVLLPSEGWPAFDISHVAGFASNLAEANRSFDIACDYDDPEYYMPWIVAQYAKYLEAQRPDPQHFGISSLSSLFESRVVMEFTLRSRKNPSLLDAIYLMTPDDISDVDTCLSDLISDLNANRAVAPEGFVEPWRYYMMFFLRTGIGQPSLVGSPACGASLFHCGDLKSFVSGQSLFRLYVGMMGFSLESDDLFPLN